MILVLSTDGDSRADALASGEALSALLLECTMVGFATCTVTHLTELSETRKFVQSLTRPSDTASPGSGGRRAGKRKSAAAHTTTTVVRSSAATSVRLKSPHQRSKHDRL